MQFLRAAAHNVNCIIEACFKKMIIFACLIYNMNSRMKSWVTPMRRIATMLLLCSVTILPAYAQTTLYKSYIDRYHGMAVSQMQRYGIPASITLAQALIESGAGQSYLAKKANNHFGIKVGTSWTGPYVLRDDDYANEKFRKYSSVAESYEDHSLFLKNGQRYSSLFSLKRTDYKGWATGLKKAGYATNPNYANILINLIESYDLHQYDSNAVSSSHRNSEAQMANALGYEFNSYNGVAYLVAKEGDTFKSLAKMLGKNARKLRSYNDAPKNYPLHAGDRVYLKSKKTKISKKLGIRTHVVQQGESLYAISQQYGIRMKNLYKLNDFLPNHVVHVGDIIKLR